MTGMQLASRAALACLMTVALSGAVLAQTVVTGVLRPDVKVYDAKGNALGTRAGAELVGRPVLSRSAIFPMIEVDAAGGRVFVNLASVTTNAPVPAAKLGCTKLGTQSPRTAVYSTNGLSSGC